MNAHTGFDPTTLVLLTQTDLISSLCFLCGSLAEFRDKPSFFFGICLPHNDTALLTRLPWATAVQKLFCIIHGTSHLFPLQCCSSCRCSCCDRGSSSQAGGHNPLDISSSLNWLWILYEASAGRCHCSTCWLYSSLKEAQVVATCDACRHTCAEGWIWPVQTNILWHSRPLGSQALALTLAFHTSLLWLKDDCWGFRKVFMSVDLWLEENFCFKTIFFSCSYSCFSAFIPLWPSRPREDVQRGA